MSTPNNSITLETADDLKEYKKWFEEMEGVTEDENGKHSNSVLAFASSDGPLANNALVGIRTQLDADDNFTKMASARDYSDKVALVQRLANWRASLWSRGFRLVHQHKAVEQVYRDLADKFNLSLSISELMRDISTTNNGAIIWAVAEDSDELAYLKTYRPESTRIEILARKFWLKPTDALMKEIQNATSQERQAYIDKTAESGKASARRLIDAIAHPEAGLYPGFIPMQEKDGEYWEIIRGSGGSSQIEYDSPAMQSIFVDIELLNMLIEGDWATAFLLKNMIMLVKVGESIDQGPLAGSRRNWAKTVDVNNLKAQIQKTGKAQIVYGNHTIEIEFAHPKPEVFSPDKYDAVIDRIATFFGISRNLIGSSGSSTGSSSYSGIAWNVQTIRIDAREKREIVEKHLQTVFEHPTIVAAAFRENKDVYWHDCFVKLDENLLTFVDTDFKNLKIDNIGELQYSRNGWKTSRTVKVKQVLVDNSSLVLDFRLPANAEPEQFRLFLTGAQIIKLLGPPNIVFDERGLKEDRQVLQEVQFAKQDGIISQLRAAEELGWHFDSEIAQKRKELSIPELIMPLFEKNQGMSLLLQQALGIGIDMIEGPNGAPGKPGRPDERPETTQDTNQQPRPSTASYLDPNDFAAMTDEDLVGMNIEIAAWESLNDVPVRLKTLHNVKLTLAQINGIAKQAEAIGTDEEKNGWAIARANFQDNHHIANGKWIKNKN